MNYIKNDLFYKLIFFIMSLINEYCPYFKIGSCIKKIVNTNII